MLDAFQVALIFLVVVIGLLFGFVAILGNSVKREIEKLTSETESPEEKMELQQRFIRALYPPRFPKD
jgi:hypothetical protein